MKSRSFLSSVFLSFILFIGLAAVPKQEPQTIHGSVKDLRTGKPVENVYILIGGTEEEAITDKQGKFTLRTWQKLPVMLKAEHARYLTLRTKVTSTKGTVALKLERKN